MLKQLEDAGDKYILPRLEASPVLMEMFDFIKSNNPGGNNPYHNTDHMYHMAGIAVMLWRGTPEYARIGEKSRERFELCLIIACLWHDYAHSGGATTDDVNIKGAVVHFSAFWRHHWRRLCKAILGKRVSNATWQQVPNQLRREIILLIEVTQFPFIKIPADGTQKCIRDADLLYTFTPRTGAIVRGLFEELYKHQRLPTGWKFTQFLGGQKQFLANCELFTEQGKQIHQQYRDYISELQISWAIHHGLVDQSIRSDMMSHNPQSLIDKQPKTTILMYPRKLYDKVFTNPDIHIYIPIDTIGNPCPIDKARVLECWTPHKTERRHQLPEIFASLAWLSHTIIRDLKEPHWGTLAQAAACGTLLGLDSWIRTAERRSDLDIYHFEVFVEQGKRA